MWFKCDSNTKEIFTIFAKKQKSENKKLVSVLLISRGSSGVFIILDTFYLPLISKGQGCPTGGVPCL